jgi:hypothetical protein
VGSSLVNIFNGLAKAEVNNFMEAICSHDVLKLQIPVENRFIVQFLSNQKGTDTPRQSCLRILMDCPY